MAIVPLEVKLDWVLCGLSILLAITTSYTALDVIGRLRADLKQGNRLWWAVGSVALGIGIWATQFTGLQAVDAANFELSFEVYDLWLAIASLLLAFTVAAISVSLLSRSGDSTRGFRRGGIVLGFGIACVHVLAMQALRVPRVVGSSMMLQAFVLVGAVGMTSLSVRLAFAGGNAIGERDGSWSPRRLVAAILLGGSMSGLNLLLLQMANYELPQAVPQADVPTVTVPDLGAAAIASCTLVILFITLLNAFNDHLRLKQLSLVAMQERNALVEAEVARLRALEQLKTDFLNAASHELRTPLTSILGYAEFLEDGIGGALNETHLGFVHQIQEGAARLRHLVDDLIVFARLEAGTFQLSLQREDLAEVVAQDIASLAPQAGQANVMLSFHRPNAPVTLEFDRHRLGQVVLNLVGNAIKFNRPGGRVDVRIIPDGQGVTLEVEDSGIGIAPHNIGRLFEKFFQVDPSSTREHGGAGLGLAIAKAIVEAHGGTMGCRSELGAGSTFYFHLQSNPRPQFEIEAGQTAQTGPVKIG